MPLRVQCSPLDLGLQLVFLVRQQRHPHVGVAGAAQILGGELLRLGTERETHEAEFKCGRLEGREAEGGDVHSLG